MNSLRKNKINAFIEKNALWVLFIMWSFMQVYLLHSLGINIGGESLRSIMEATNLFLGKGISTPGNYMYFTESFLIFLAMKM
ncbi:MAG: hypothetical protein ABI091_13430, partial [Ferruginibacter sp.]